MNKVKMFLFSFLLTLSGITILLIASLLLSRVSHAKEVIKLEKLKIDYHKFTPSSRDAFIVPNLPNTQLDSQIKLSIDMDILKYVYWNNNVYTITDKTLGPHSYQQFRYVSWEYHFGIRVLENFNLEFYHKSEHLLDATPSIQYPMINSIGVSYTIYSNPQKPGSIF